ncbi:MAG: L,D-transpeptidase [Bacteroidia bacterium]
MNKILLKVLVLLSACSNPTPPIPETQYPEKLHPPALQQKLPVDSIEQKAPERVIQYSLVAFDSLGFSDTVKAAVYVALNRLDAAHFRPSKKYIVPDVYYADLLKYSPFPIQVNSLHSVDKCILISYAMQAFAAYEYGQLIRWGPTSLGKKSTPTPTGLFHCNWKSKKTISTIDPEWIMEWYINLENKLGVSMHQYDLPGYPASHACVRLLKQDAVFLYRWTNTWELMDDWTIKQYGTPVIIFGDYVYEEHQPWFKDGVMRYLNEQELTEELNLHLPAIISRQKKAVDSVAVVVP